MNKVCLNFNYWKIQFAFITIRLLSEIRRSVYNLYNRWYNDIFYLLFDVLIKSRLHITSYTKIDDRSLCDGFFDCPGQEDENPEQCLFYKTVSALICVEIDTQHRILGKYKNRAGLISC